MDPISIAAIAARASTASLTTIRALRDLRAKYQAAPVILVTICSEMTVISASLAQIQNLLLQREDLAEVWQSRGQLPMVLDQALTGAMVIVSCLDAEIHRLSRGASNPGWDRWKPRLRFLWSESRLDELLASTRGHQTAMTLLIQLLQVDTMAEIMNTLQERGDVVEASAAITKSLRAENPSLSVANSIYDTDDHAKHTSGCDVASVVAPSELAFSFDDQIVNSEAYRRAMAHSKARPAIPDKGSEKTADGCDETVLNLAKTAKGSGSGVLISAERLEELERTERKAKEMRDTARRIYATNKALLQKSKSIKKLEVGSTVRLLAPSPPRPPTPSHKDVDRGNMVED